MRRFLKRWRLWLAASAVFLIVFDGIVAVSRDSAGDPFRKIKKGMTKDEVDQLIGDKQIQYSTEDLTAYYARESRLRGHPGGSIIVMFEKTKPPRVREVRCSRNFDRPDNRIVWQRIQDEYRYQMRRLGW